MDIKINDTKFPKDDLIKLITNGKLQAIVHIRNVVNIGLKDAKEIVENLEMNPNYYDNSVINVPEKELAGEEISTLHLKNTAAKNSNTFEDKKVGSHIIKGENKTRKLIYVLGLIFIITFLILLLVDFLE